MQKSKNIEMIIEHHYCQGKDCIFFVESGEEINHHKNVQIDDREYKNLSVGWKDFLCKKDSELQNIRKEIYAKADKQFDSVYAKASNWELSVVAREEIEKEWTEFICPFYKTKEE